MGDPFSSAGRSLNNATGGATGRAYNSYTDFAGGPQGKYVKDHTIGEGGFSQGMPGILDNLAQNDPTNVTPFQSAMYTVDRDPFTNEERSNALRSSFAQQLAADKGRTTGIDIGKQQYLQDRQMDLSNQLERMSNGQEPSLATMMLNQGAQNAARGAASQMSSMRGMNPALAARSIANQSQNAYQNAANQSAMARMQEQMGALGQRSGLLNQMRGSDLGMRELLANTNLRQQEVNDQMSKFFNTGIAEQNAQDRQAKMALEKLRADQVAGVNATNAAGYASAQAAKGNIIGGMGGAIAAMGAMSDEELKRKMKGGEGELEKAMNEYSLQSKQVSDRSPAADPMGAFSKSFGLGSKLMGGQKSAGGASGISTDTGGIGNIDVTAACGGMVPHKYAFGKALMESGGRVPGKASVEGDSEKNDNVKALLSPGEIVLPRTVSEDAMDNPDSEKLQEFLDALRAHKYTYKDPKHALGSGDNTPRISPMAQELEKSSLGKMMVSQTPEGKMVDYGKGLGVMMAAHAHANQRLNKLERMYGGGEVSFADAKTDPEYQHHADSIQGAFYTKTEDKKKTDDSEPSFMDKLKAFYHHVVD